jgi:hypothetical protein
MSRSTSRIQSAILSFTVAFRVVSSRWVGLRIQNKDERRRNSGQQNQTHQIKRGGIYRCPDGLGQARRREGSRQTHAKRGWGKAEDVGAINYWLRQLPLQNYKYESGREGDMLLIGFFAAERSQMFYTA